MAYAHKVGTAALAIAAALAAPVYAQEARNGGDQDASPTDYEAEAQKSVTSLSVDTSTEASPFYGRIDPFYGTIGAFWGNISPFYGNIGAFYGRIDPFWGDISPFYGNIGAFWGNIGAFDSAYMASVGNFWNATSTLFKNTDTTWAALSANASDPVQAAALSAQLRTQIDTLIANSKTQWGSAVTAKTGKDFQTAFVTPIFQRHGIDLNDPAALAALSSSQRAAFFLDWHDSLMGYSNFDRVDHWMGAINWTPSITQIQGSTGQSVIGILDSSLTGSADLANNLVSLTGKNGFVSGHGAGVASLMIAAHDGQGVMGIAPNAKVVAHNPFDAAGNASWADVLTGVSMLNGGNASIINLSLGEPGVPLSQEWRTVFTNTAIASRASQTVYVLAAGNDGIAQASNIDWTGAFGTNFILVGSVSPTGKISGFSNTPGTACMTNNGTCTGGTNLLMNRFIVAPGEQLLVDDGFGNVVRRSGTSFSAPLVSGSIALLHDRWPWLARNAPATVEIILRSARDLGAPGIDPIYGVGMLDVLASQSPLDFNAMTFTMYQRRGPSYKSSTVSAATLIGWGVPSWWETDSVFFTMFENVGTTYRDFAVPMSTYTKGKRTNALGGSYQRLQDFVSDRFARWILSGGTDKNGDGVKGISQLEDGVTRRAGEWSLRYSAAMPRFSEDGAIDPVHAAATLSDPSGRFAFSMGYGQGAIALSGDRFGMISDYNSEDGGANPVLGFASGEFFTGASMELGATTKIGLGYSQNRLDWEDASVTQPLERYFLSEIGAREAHAFSADIEQKITSDLSLNLQYTRLQEDDALLGAQTGYAFLLGEGAQTEAVTLSATLRFGDRTRLDLATTAGETVLAEGQFLTNEEGVFTTAAQVALTHNGLFSKRDSLRLSVGQPLNIEQGELQFYSLQVINRETGERGMVAQDIGIETKRRIMGELVYAAPLMKQGEVGLFGRFVSEGVASEGEGIIVGANLGLRF